MEISGHKINNSSLGWTLAKCVRDQVTYLEKLGVVFDKNEAGEMTPFTPWARSIPAWSIASPGPAQRACCS
ncbi:MAG: hypothetical protein V8R75_06755 [Oscillospiraceae bacterium]